MNKEKKILTDINNAIIDCSGSGSGGSIDSLFANLFFDPKNSKIYEAIGDNYKDKNIDIAKSFYRLAIINDKKKNDSISSFIKLAQLYVDNETIITILKQAPDNPIINNMIGVYYARIKKNKEAEEYFTRASNGNNIGAKIDALNNLGTLTLDNYKAIKCFNQAAKLVACGSGGGGGGDGLPLAYLQNKLLRLNRIYVDINDTYNEHLKITNKMQKELIKDFSKELTKDFSLPRIGYVSSDFIGHAVVKFIMEILKGHQKFKVFCYYNNVINPDPRVISRSIKEYEKINVTFKNINHLSDEQAYNLIMSDKIDILVDLNGHTEGNRLGIFALKPAKIQVSYLGYPNTTGLKQIDYRLGDLIADTETTTVYQKYSEKLILLDFFLLYRPNDIGFDIRFTGVETGPPNYPIRNEVKYEGGGGGDCGITFGIVNNFFKFSKEFVNTVKEIIKKCNCRILIKTTQDQEEYIKLFGHNNKIIYFPNNLENVEYYSFFNKIDATLDTFPYTGTTTTCDSLYMGVPVITLSGKTHAHNVSKSIILNTCEKNGIITSTINDYINAAINCKERNKTNAEEIRKNFIKGMNVEKFMIDYENKLIQLTTN